MPKIYEYLDDFDVNAPEVTNVNNNKNFSFEKWNLDTLINW